MGALDSPNQSYHSAIFLIFKNKMIYNIFVVVSDKIWQIDAFAIG